jgi:diadenosine tetraphosphate (Ap4A) HIT family hydrolase
LVVPRRHEPNFLSLSDNEHAAIWGLAREVRAIIDRDHHPNGYNLGVNVGSVAGQTVDHAHLHIIPRYAGDVPEPRGGIRWIIPSKARYW